MRLYIRFVIVIFGAVLIYFLNTVPVIGQLHSSITAINKTNSPIVSNNQINENDLPLKQDRIISFTTDEGTWVSLDVSPDGSTIIFDLLGDLYKIPITGGSAEQLTDGMGFEAQPKFSPCGDKIVFISDRGGAENVWIMNAYGDDLQKITNDENVHFATPLFSPDGRAILVSRAGPRRTYQLWVYHLDGGRGSSLTASFEGMNVLGATFIPDSEDMYISRRQGAFGFSIPQWQLAKFNTKTKKLESVTDLYGGAVRPLISPDGRWLVYGSRFDRNTGLRLRDIKLGTEKWLLHPIQRDQQETLGSRDMLPGMAFTPDSKEIVISFKGKIWRVTVPEGEVNPVPFRVDINKPLGPKVDFRYNIDDEPGTSRHIRHPQLSPDGQKIAFSALNRIWVADFPDGEPREIASKLNVPKHQPVWSPDGRFIAFVTWSDYEGGNIYRVKAKGNDNAERLTQISAFYSMPAYSPDGERIVVVKTPYWHRIQRRYQGAGDGLELHWLPANGGATTLVSRLEGTGPHGRLRQPHFTDDPNRIYIYQGGEGLISMRIDGSDRQEHGRFIGYTGPESPVPWSASEVLISPDGSKVIAEASNQVYLIDLPLVGESVDIRLHPPENAIYPVTRLSEVAGEFMGWGKYGEAIIYSLAHTVFVHELHPDLEFKSEPKKYTINVPLEKDRPYGNLMLSGARLITMRGEEVIEKGDILIHKNLIVAIGKSGELKVPENTTILDVSGTTILPGFVDVHHHNHALWQVTQSQPWEFLVNLAYGITTLREPQPTTSDIFHYSELIETGEILGPRLFTTGPGVFQRGRIQSYEDARTELRRYSEFYNTRSIKQYAAGNRKQRQWIIEAARDQGLIPTTEGYHDLRLQLTHVQDGYPSLEHNFPIVPLYKDVIEFLNQASVTYTPTLQVAFGGPGALSYFLSTTDLLSQDRLLRFMRPQELYRAKRGSWFHPDEHIFIEIARMVTELYAAGVRIGVGSHGNFQGLGFHWEMWSFSYGGMSNHDVLRCGTILGAKAIGYGDDIGSLDEGKLADLIVLNDNPLDDIKHTVNVKYVVKNGEVFEAETLDRIWPSPRTLDPLPWWSEIINLDH